MKSNVTKFRKLRPAARGPRGPKGEKTFEVRDVRDKFFMMDDAYLNGWAKIIGIYGTGVYVALCRHASVSEQQCFPSGGLMAEELAISRWAVVKALKKLRDHHIISVQGKRGGKHIYTLLDKSCWVRKPRKDHVEL
jgi:hypothetical protein